MGKSIDFWESSQLKAIFEKHPHLRDRTKEDSSCNLPVNYTNGHTREKVKSRFSGPFVEGIFQSPA